jgi:hypothetical protein
MIALLLVNIASAANVEDFAELMVGAWRTAPSGYSTTFSPCLDGLIVNFKGAGCTAPTKLNGWSQNEHVIFTTASHSVQDFAGWDTFCVDPNITMYVPERPKLRPQ